MSAITGIEWTDRTWNCVRGCARVSPGCEHCYAERQAHRFSGAGRPYEGLTVLGKHGPRWAGRARFVPAMLDEPLRWRKPQRVFVNSMSDLFHEDIANEHIAEVFGVMAICPRHTFQVLTKRPARVLQWFEWAREHLVIAQPGPAWPLPNVWLGVSAEDQKRADERIPLLLETPAAVRFISAEPLLGPLDLRRIQHDEIYASDALTGDLWEGRRVDRACQERLDWVIVGGESGHGARSCNVDWIRSIVTQCASAKVACFVKQLGAIPYEERPATGPQGPDAALERIMQGDKHPQHKWFHGWTLTHTPDGVSKWVKHHRLSSKGGVPGEWPVELRVRQFPEARSKQLWCEGSR